MHSTHPQWSWRRGPFIQVRELLLSGTAVSRDDLHSQPFADLLTCPFEISSITARSFALRMDRSTLIPRRTGRSAVVADQSAFETETGELVDLALQLFGEDGLL